MADERLYSSQVLHEGTLQPATLLISGSAIADVVAGRLPDSLELNGAVLPGIVDSHVHLNEPGRAEWEGFETATRAALAGGITTLVDMPLNSSPVTTTPAAFEAKLRAAEGKLAVDVAYWGGVIPGNTHELQAMASLGVRGFKCFMIDSGLPEFPAVDDVSLLQAMQELARLGLPLLAHAERDEQPDQTPNNWHSTKFSDFLASRPPRFEDDAIHLLLKLAEQTGCHVHVVHLSSANTLPAIATAKARGVKITVETCPHYLTFAAEEIPDGATEFKCTPPIRFAENRERLWAGLRDGHIDAVVCDHSPCTPALKNRDTGDFGDAWGGIASLGVSLSAVWTEAHRRGFTLPQVMRWMTANPAALAGLQKKGHLRKNADADFIVFHPDTEFVVRGAELHHKHKLTPYEGKTLRGAVQQTFMRGHAVTVNQRAGHSLRGQQ